VDRSLFVLSQSKRLTDRQTYRQMDSFFLAIPLYCVLRYMQSHGKNCKTRQKPSVHTC